MYFFWVTYCKPITLIIAMYVAVLFPAVSVYIYIYISWWMHQSQTTAQQFPQRIYCCAEEPQIKARDVHVPWVYCVSTPVCHFHRDCLSIISILILQERADCERQCRQWRDLEAMICAGMWDGRGRVIEHRLEYLLKTHVVDSCIFYAAPQIFYLSMNFKRPLKK